MASAIFADGRIHPQKKLRDLRNAFVVPLGRILGFQGERMLGARRLDALDGRPLNWRGVWLWFYLLCAGALVPLRWRLLLFAASRPPPSRLCSSNSNRSPSVLRIPK